MDLEQDIKRPLRRCCNKDCDSYNEQYTSHCMQVNFCFDMFMPVLNLQEMDYSRLEDKVAMQYGKGLVENFPLDFKTLGAISARLNYKSEKGVSNL